MCIRDRYYIRQDNNPALDEAQRQDMGVFIISPTDKGGHLHSPSQRLIELCAPLHPIVFNDLFCLSDPRVHTISVGAAKASDFDRHLEALALLPQAAALLEPIDRRLQRASRDVLGDSWVETWHQGLPTWEQTPGQINLPVLLWLHNLLEAWDLCSFAQARYRLLGNGGHWFPGANADGFDDRVTEAELLGSLGQSPWAGKIPGILRSLRERLSGAPVRRLTQD